MHSDPARCIALFRLPGVGGRKMVVETVQIACDCRDVVLAKPQADVALPTADLALERRPVGREPLFAPVDLRRMTADALSR